MEAIFWHLHIYRLLVAQYMKKRMQYRVDYLVNLLGGIISSLAKLFTIWLIYQSIPTLQGWNFYELLFFLGFFQAAMLPYGLVFSSFWDLSGDIRSGNFISYYFRPLNMMFYYTSKQFDLQGPLISFIIAIVMLVYAGAHLAIPWTIWTVLLLIVNWGSSSLIIAAILVGGMTMSFWIINAGWLTMVLSAIRDNSQYPLTIFNKAFQIVFTFIIPIGFITYYPCLPLLRPASEVPLAAWFSPVVGFIIFYLVYQLWKKGVNHYSGTGS